MEISAEKVKSVFSDVLAGKMTREEADRWAFSIVNALETKKNVVFNLQKINKKFGMVYYIFMASI